MAIKYFANIQSKLKNFRSSKIFYLAVIIIGLALLITYKKSWFIAATINGTPISSFELLARENLQFKTQTLNQIINEKIIFDEARKNNVTVSEQELNSKMAELEKNVGGAQSLDSLLTQQGQTRESLKNQIMVQLTVEKLYAKEATVSADEVTTFLEQNRNSLSATTAAQQQKEAEDNLKQQKLSQIFNEKFQALKQAAQIKIF